MLPVSEIVRVVESRDAEGRYPLAEEAALLFGLRDPRFVRSSANHVFVGTGADGGGVVLRIRPGLVRGPDVALTDALRGGGAPLVAWEPWRELGWAGATYSAQAMPALDGEQLEADDADGEQLAAWGHALGRLHAASLGLGEPGLVVGHGDPELDNVVWTTVGPVFVDPDDLGWTHWAADASFALRDLQGDGTAAPTHDPRVRAFLDGYRHGRPGLTDRGYAEGLALWPVFVRRHAAVTAARLTASLAEPRDPAWPGWALRLRDRLEAMHAELVARVCAEP